MSKSSSRRNFKNGAMRVNKKNRGGAVMRGGYRL